MAEYKSEADNVFRHKVINISIIAAILLSCMAYVVNAQSPRNVNIIEDEDGAVRTLREYLQLRTQDALWDEYSKYITWPDEPGWDCYWVSSSYKLGQSKIVNGKVVIPVDVVRVGLYCVDNYFEPKKESVVINYELVKRNNKWKVDGPTPDYPDVGADTIINQLNKVANDNEKTPEQRASAADTARRVAEALAN